MFFVGQDKKDISNIANTGYYNKSDFIEMLYACAGLSTVQLPQEDIDAIKSDIAKLKEERKVILQQHKILKSRNDSVSYLSTTSDRLAFGQKVSDMEKLQQKIAELRKSRNSSQTRKSKWETTVKELRSLNRTIECGELRCMECNSTNIMFSTGKKQSYTFDVSTIEMRNEIIESIEQKISSYDEEIERLSNEISRGQERLQDLMSDETVTLESIVAYKKDVFSASDAEKRIIEIDIELTTLKGQLQSNENAVLSNSSKHEALIAKILEEMNFLYNKIDPSGNIIYSSLFTKKSELYSGSEATIFHLVKLLAFQEVLKHNYPIIIDSFRAEDLSTTKENIVLELCRSKDNQMIFTTTLKTEELGKYDNLSGINHIDYLHHAPSKILSNADNEKFRDLLSNLAIEL